RRRHTRFSRDWSSDVCSSDLLRRAADRGRLRILANDRARQAVALPSLGLTAANFWQPGTAGPLTATAPAGVLLRRRGRTATLCEIGRASCRERGEMCVDVGAR